MHSAAILEIANHCDMRTIQQLAQAREFSQDRVQIQQCLAWMFAGAVATIDHRDIRRVSKLRHRALLRVAHHQGIDITTHYPTCVVDGLALCHRRKGEAGGVAYRTAQAAEGGSETDTRSGTCLKKKISQNRPFEDARHLLTASDWLHQISNAEQFFDRFPRKLVYRQELMFTVICDSIS